MEFTVAVSKRVDTSDYIVYETPRLGIKRQVTRQVTKTLRLGVKKQIPEPPSNFNTKKESTQEDVEIQAIRSLIKKYRQELLNLRESVMKDNTKFMNCINNVIKLSSTQKNLEVEEALNQKRKSIVDCLLSVNKCYSNISREVSSLEVKEIDTAEICAEIMEDYIRNMNKAVKQYYVIADSNFTGINKSIAELEHKEAHIKEVSGIQAYIKTYL